MATVDPRTPERLPMDAARAEFPVTVMLRFRSEEERDRFMGGLSDGFGESACDLDWDLRLQFHEVTEFFVELSEEEREEMERVARTEARFG